MHTCSNCGHPVSTLPVPDPRIDWSENWEIWVQHLSSDDKTYAKDLKPGDIIYRSSVLTRVYDEQPTPHAVYVQTAAISRARPWGEPWPIHPLTEVVLYERDGVRLERTMS